MLPRLTSTILILAILSLASPSIAGSRDTHIVCSEDVLPADTVVVATGTSPVCHGSCRARKIEPVRGSIMIICANQPIPKDYALDSVTTTPDCRCLGNEDNAYVIRKLESHEREQEEGISPTPPPMPYYRQPVWESQKLPDFRTGD
jgi:glycine/D-amino acid oxidase-like deaminating enzyme